MSGLNVNNYELSSYLADTALDDDIINESELLEAISSYNTANEGEEISGSLAISYSSASFTFDGDVLDNDIAGQTATITDTEPIADDTIDTSTFDAAWYLENNPDLPADWTEEEATTHYITFGYFEGRACCEAEASTSTTEDSTPAASTIDTSTFDAEWYLANNPDLVEAGYDEEDVIDHYTTFGYAEGRACCEDAASTSTDGDITTYTPADAAMAVFDIWRGVGETTDSGDPFELSKDASTSFITENASDQDALTEYFSELISLKGYSSFVSVYVTDYLQSLDSDTVENFGDENDTSTIYEPTDELINVIQAARLAMGKDELSDEDVNAFIDGASGDGASSRECEEGNLTYLAVLIMLSH